MSTDKSELFLFYKFVAGKLQNGEAGLTPEQCLDLWRLQHPNTAHDDCIVTRIQSAIDEMEQETGGVSADELHCKLRSEYSGFATE